MTRPDFPAFVAELAVRVEAELTTLLDREETRWANEHPDLRTPFVEMRSLVLGGGKRLRPAFCLLGALAVGGSANDQVVRAGAALEMVHATALFHDDVIDASTSRRGLDTAHVRQARVHRDNAWAGESSRFGEGIAILVGDLAFVYADLLMESMSPRVRQVWSQMRLEVNMGQYLDVVGSARRDFTADAASRIALLKTAKYTIERPLHIGALVADPEAAPHKLDALSAYGTSLGIAFQMRDDVLGVFGAPNVTGKPAGDDLRESKPTALVVEAITRASGTQRAVLAAIGNPNLGEDEIDDIRGVIVETGALAAVEARIGELSDEAVRGLDSLDMNDDAHEKFLAMSHAVAWRSL